MWATVPTQKPVWTPVILRRCASSPPVLDARRSLKDGRKQDEDGSELSPQARAERAAAPYLSAVWRVVGGVLVGGGAGWFIDGKLHSSPWGLIVGLFVGMGAGFYGLIQALNSMKKS